MSIRAAPRARVVHYASQGIEHAVEQDAAGRGDVAGEVAHGGNVRCQRAGAYGREQSEYEGCHGGRRRRFEYAVEVFHARLFFAFAVGEHLLYLVFQPLLELVGGGAGLAKAKRVRSFTCSLPPSRRHSSSDDHVTSYRSAEASSSEMSITRRRSFPSATCGAKFSATTSRVSFSIATHVAQRRLAWNESTSTPSACVPAIPLRFPSPCLRPCCRPCCRPPARMPWPGPRAGL